MADPAPLSMDPYLELGLDPSVPDVEIRKAYFALVRMHSPEKDPNRFKRIRAAYEQLSEPGKRFQTDMLRIQPWLAPELPPIEADAQTWTQDVLRAARAFSDLDRRHFREDFHEVKL